MDVYKVMENSGLDMRIVMLADVMRYVYFLKEKFPKRDTVSKSYVKRRLSTMGYSEEQISKYFPFIGSCCEAAAWADGDIIFKLKSNVEPKRPAKPLEVVR